MWNFYSWPIFKQTQHQFNKLLPILLGFVSILSYHWNAVSRLSKCIGRSQSLRNTRFVLRSTKLTHSSFTGQKVNRLIVDLESISPSSICITTRPMNRIKIGLNQYHLFFDSSDVRRKGLPKMGFSSTQLT